MRLLLSHAAVLLLGCCCNVNGYCHDVWVTGTTTNTYMNGEYQITSIQCDGRDTWLQVYPYTTNFMMYAGGTWYIGPKLSDLCEIVPQARAGGGSFYYPYDIPTGYWSEYNTGTEVWQTSPNMYVYCEGLSAGAIAGIVIGCVCGAVLIVLVVVMICKSVKNKKKHSACSESPHPQTAAEAAAAMQTTTVTQVQVPADTFYPNQYYYPPAGGAWPDNGEYSSIVPPPYQPQIDQSI